MIDLRNRALGEDEAARRVLAVVDKYRALSGGISVPDLKKANRESEGKTATALPATITVEWSRLVNVASINERSGRILYRTARAVNASSAIEVGSNIGIGSSWIAGALAEPQQLILMDGSDALLKVAGQSVERVAGFTPNLRPGLFAETIPALATDITPGTVDFVFLDGEHYYQPTLDAAEALIPLLRHGGALVFDDIAWNNEMIEAWSDILQGPMCAAAYEPRHRGSRRLGVFVKGPRGGFNGKPIVVDSASGPEIIWRWLRRAHAAMRSL